MWREKNIYFTEHDIYFTKLMFILKNINLELKSALRTKYIFYRFLLYLVRAGSRVSGLLVAATTTTRWPPSPPSPSISVSSAARTRSELALRPSVSLLATSASISSMKRMVGAPTLAFLKTSSTAFSLSPTYGENISAGEIARKVALQEDAIARTSLVFPQPGGPHKRTPLDGLTPSL